MQHTVTDTPRATWSMGRRHPSRRFRRPTSLAAALFVTSALAALGTGLPESAGADTAPPATRVVPSACGLSALAKARTPVQITMWHTMTQTNNTWLQNAVAQFNTAQKKVHVTLVQQPDYPSEFVKYKAGLSSGDLPDLAQFEDTTVQQLVDSQSTVPVQDCIAASHYSVSDYLARALAFYRYHGVQQSMPWSVSNVIMYYNPVAFQKAGLNPNTPPQTFAQVTAASKKIVAAHAATHGVALPAKPYVFEFLLAKSGGQYVNNGNGRIARATQAGLTSPTSLKVWRWWNQMLTSHLAPGDRLGSQQHRPPDRDRHRQRRHDVRGLRHHRARRGRARLGPVPRRADPDRAAPRPDDGWRCAGG